MSAPVYLEDFAAGQVREFGHYAVTSEEIIDFATRYDPQPFHTDPDAAKSSFYGGLIGSGWMTCAIAMRMVCDDYILKSASLGSPGVDQIRWKQPVRPADVLRMRVTVLEARPSQSKPDRGIVRTGWEVINQRDEVVMTSEGMGMFRCRPAHA
ncbi:MAG: MaoC family dehydratase [Betaproteobacteria bacterium]